MSSRKIVKDNLGFLWIATQEGLVKYVKIDPTSYSVNDPNGKHSLLNADVSDIALDSNTLVALNVFGGLSCLNTQTGHIFKQIKFQDNLPLFGDGNITRLAFTDSCVIMPLPNGKVISYNIFTDKHTETLALEKLIIGSRIDLIKQIENYIFLGISNGTIAIIDKQLNLISSCQLGSNKNFTEIRCNSIERINKSNDYIIATSSGIKLISEKNNVFENTALVSSGLASIKKMVYCTSIFENKLYYCSDYGLFRASLPSLTNVEKIEDFSNQKINFFSQSYQIFCTASHALVASFNGIAEIALNEGPFIPIRKNNTTLLALDHCTDLRVYEKELWVAGNNGILKYNLETRVPTAFNVKNYFLHILKLPNQQIIGCGSEGLVVLQSGKFIKASQRFKELNGIADFLFATSGNFKDSLIFLGAEYNKGVFVWDIKRHTVSPLCKDESINNLYTNKIFIVGDSVLLVGERRIMIYNTRTKKYSVCSLIIPASKLDLSILMDMITVKDKYWFAVYGVGLVQANKLFEVEKIIDKHQGIANLGLYKLFSIGDSVVIASSNNGIFTYNSITKAVKSYFEGDGLHGNGFEEFSGFQTHDEVIMGGLNGFTIINPNLFKENKTPPKLYFQNIEIETNSENTDTCNASMLTLSIPNNYTQTRISFIALNNLKEEQVTYSYKIPQLGSKWIDLKTRNFIPLIGISPGTYTLEVKAANEDGVECAPISMTLHFQPKWYQTWQFKLAVVLAIAGLLYTLYSFRIRQLKRIISVRQKISSDLHDDIGSTLSTINMYSQVAQLHGPGHVPIMHNIQENAQEVLEKLDDIVWATNPKNDQVKNLVERIDTFARPLLQAKEIQFIFNAESHISSHKIGEATRQNLFLICKEAITNTAKYAECKTCTVSLYKKGKYLHCTITDDGKGFNATLPTERNGLLNMKLRATAVKGKLEIVSSTGNGTSIRVVMPL